MKDARGLARLGAWWGVASLAACGALLTWFGWVRPGGYLIAASFAVAAALRLLLPADLAGGLVIRRRYLDVATLSAVALALAVAFSLVRL